MSFFVTGLFCFLAFGIVAAVAARWLINLTERNPKFSYLLPVHMIGMIVGLGAIALYFRIVPI